MAVVDMSKPPGQDEVRVSGRVVDGGLSPEPASRAGCAAEGGADVGGRRGKRFAGPLHLRHRIRREPHAVTAGANAEELEKADSR